MKIERFTQASELWSAYRVALHDYLSRRIGDRVLAEELTQRVLLKVVDTCCSGVEIRNVRAWLYQISRNVHTDYLKEQTRARTQVPSHPEAPSPETVWREMTRYLPPLLRLLPEQYATPLRLADLGGMKQQQVADRLGIGLSAVKSRIQRARVMLREKIAECSYLELDAAGRPTDFAIRKDCRCLQEPFVENC